jgi:hypothetical protein
MIRVSGHERSEVVTCISKYTTRSVGTSTQGQRKTLTDASAIR